MVDKVHGVVHPGEKLTKNMDFFTVRTTLDISRSSTNDPADASQARLDKLVEAISMYAQPVIIGAVTSDAETGPISDLPSVGTGDEPDVYTFKFAVEHEDVIDTETLLLSLDGVLSFVYSVGVTSDNNVACAKADTL